MITLLAGVAAAQTATFDGIAEGTNGALIADGGLAFTNLDNRGLSPIPGNIAIEQADADLAGLPGFTPTMALGFGGYSAGPGASFGRFGAIEISNGGLGDAAELYVFESGFQGGLVLTLDALSGGVVVASDSEPLNAGFGIVSHTLSVSGATFDLLRLSVGPLPTDAAFILLDTVTISYGAVGTTGDTGGAPADTADTGGIDTDSPDTDPPDTDPPDTDPPDTDPQDTDPQDTDLPDTADTGGTDTEPPDTEPPTTSDDDVPPDDTGVAVDDKDGGCGCASGPPTVSWMLLLPLLLLRRR